MQHMSDAVQQSGLVTDQDLSDWGILLLPSTTQDEIDDYSTDYYFSFSSGLAGGDMTTFTENCYEIIQETEQTYHYAEGYGCPAHIMKYYDGFMFGLQANYFSDDASETYYNNDYLYDNETYFFICPGESMDCAYLYMDYGITGDNYAKFTAGIARVNTYDFEDDGDLTFVYSYDQHWQIEYPNYGFSSTQFGSVMNSYAGSGLSTYWFAYNAGSGFMHFHRFLAVNDERLDIGDTLTVWVAEDEYDETMSTSLELASGVSLAASAAAVLASATLL